MAQGIVDVAKVVEIQITQHQTLLLVLGQGIEQQRLEALAVDDTGVRVLLGELLQRALQVAALTHVAQATAQHLGAQLISDQPVHRTFRGVRRFFVEQQDQRPGIAPDRRPALRRGQQQAGRCKQLAGRLPAGRDDQPLHAMRSLQAVTQPRRPFGAIG